VLVYFALLSGMSHFFSVPSASPMIQTTKWCSQVAPLICEQPSDLKPFLPRCTKQLPRPLYLVKYCQGYCRAFHPWKENWSSDKKLVLCTCHVPVWPS
jgi:hypothetical protein